MYLTHEATGHEIPVALGNTMAMGSILFHRANQFFPTGFEVLLGAKRPGVGAIRDGALVLSLAERVELRESPPQRLGRTQVEH